VEVLGARYLEKWEGACGGLDSNPFDTPGYNSMHTGIGEDAMKRTIPVRISKGDRQFVAECLDLPVVTQAVTLDELANNIREAISLHLDGEDLAELGIAVNPTIIATMELEAVA
jgi:predicted RNase H-like HicB family nuclease